MEHKKKRPVTSVENLVTPEKEHKKKPRVTSVEELVTPEKEHKKKRAVTKSPKKKAKQHSGKNQKVTSARAQEENVSAKEGQVEIHNPAADSVRKDLSSIFDAETDGSKEEGEGHRVTAAAADTLMGFGKYRNKTYREVATYHQGYVQWARREQRSNGIAGQLSNFVDWLDTREGQQLDSAAQGGNREYTGGQHNGDGGGYRRFTFGQHKGDAFWLVAKEDPSYHLRYLAIHPWARYESSEFNDYVAYFGRYGDRFEARRQCRLDLAGFVPFCHFD
mmetsp:Transcript_19099/g.47210  ORF Transcript_19099/g.47210 Transcript_19099/m.47210 type:complete len:276 (+) Transcript_19099:147-974(+)